MSLEQEVPQLSRREASKILITELDRKLDSVIHHKTKNPHLYLTPPVEERRETYEEIAREIEGLKFPKNALYNLVENMAFEEAGFRAKNLRGNFFTSHGLTALSSGSLRRDECLERVIELFPQTKEILAQHVWSKFTKYYETNHEYGFSEVPFSLSLLLLGRDLGCPQEEQPLLAEYFFYDFLLHGETTPEANYFDEKNRKRQKGYQLL